jgi:O-antigen/teichoic acid export membrane protein
MVGNTMTWWFTESGFILLVVGATLGPVQLGAARAVQNLVSLANPLILSLENFAPSAATKALVAGGPRALLRYVRGVALLGSGGLLLLTAALTAFVDPILHVVYGQTFPNAAAITAILGTCVAIAYSTSVIYAGLRALEQVRDTFFFQAVMAAICLATAWSVAADWGVVGALGALLAVRLTMLGLFAYSLGRHARLTMEHAR